jgi:hypothetical protein
MRKKCEECGNRRKLFYAYTTIFSGRNKPNVINLCKECFYAKVKRGVLGLIPHKPIYSIWED